MYTLFANRKTSDIKPPSPMLIWATFRLPILSLRGPPINAPAPYVRNVMVEISPMVPKPASRSVAIVVINGGNTRKRLWLRLWATPSSSKSMVVFFMAVMR